jgi:formylglycine-generating enzyme required for sulfatase activity
MKFILIPNGTFTMGSPPDEEKSNDEERQHKVTLTRDFYMGIYEVSQAEYQAVIGTNPSVFQGDRVAERHPKTNRIIRDGDSSHHPVESVSWKSAVLFCDKLSEMADEKAAERRYRLPTEAEWEYACRAGAPSAFSFGETPGDLESVAWFDRNSNRVTHACGQKAANKFGLFDMHGNVAEWCFDWHAANIYDDAPILDPSGPETGKYRVVRGGHWKGEWHTLRCAARSKQMPQFPEGSGSDAGLIGFRVICETVETAKNKGLADRAINAAKPPRQKPSDSSGTGGLLNVPINGQAVTKGSFTAFTIPADPPQKQAYSIVIEVKLPDDVNKYPVSDLSGRVIGSDGYEQELPYDSRKSAAAGYPIPGGGIKRLESNTILDVVNNKVQIVIRVPGGARQVRDRITIHSKLLREALEIELFSKRNQE